MKTTPDPVHLGNGIFHDAYDLFIIGVVMEMLKSEWAVRLMLAQTQCRSLEEISALATATL